MANAYFYFLSNAKRTLLYAGATTKLSERINLHEKGIGAVFTKKYNVKYLIYFEAFDEPADAFKREKQIKNWRKEWKWSLTKKINPDLLDLGTNFD